MIREIYGGLMQDLPEEDEISLKLKREIIQLLQEEKEKMECDDYKKYRDKAFVIASAGEEAGFVRGFRFAFCLFVECIGNIQ